MPEPRAKSSPTASAVTDWLMSLGWKTVVVTEHYVLAAGNEFHSDTVRVWCRHWVEDRITSGVGAAREYAAHLPMIELIERIAKDAMKGATK